MNELKTNTVLKVLVTGFALVILSFYGQAQLNAAGTVSGITAEIAVELELTESQLQKVAKFSGMLESQAKMDRENFKGNPLALIEAAKRREKMAYTHLETLLEVGQMESLDSMKRSRRRNRELFMLKEGLLLSPEQVSRINVIIEDFRKQQIAQREAKKNQKSGKGGSMHEGRGGGMRGGGMGGGMRGGGKGGGGGMRGGGKGGMGDGMDQGDRINAMMEKMEKQLEKKVTLINDFLTETQQQMVPPILELLKTEMRARMNKKMEQRRRKRS